MNFKPERAALAPRLTALDERVLAEVPADRSVRLSAVHEAMGRRLATEQEVREILRGLEALGLVSSRWGWWRRG